MSRGARKPAKIAKLCLFFVLVARTSVAQVASAPPSPQDLLKQNILRISDGVRADWGIYAKSLDTGEEVAINADSSMETMSVIKVPILVSAFRQVDAGKLNLSQPITLNLSDKRFGTGVLQTLHEGLVLTLHDALTLMIIQSDNTATDVVYALVGGPPAVTQTMRQLGFKTITSVRTSFDWFRAFAAASDPSYLNLSPGELFTRGFPSTPSRAADVARFDADGKTPYGLASPREIGALLGKIVKGEAASSASCTEMVRILRLQQMNTRIPKYLAGATVGHKTGDFPPFIANDVGFVEGPRSIFVLAVFDDRHHGTYGNLEDAVARITQQAWLYFNYRGEGSPP
jgi:beta-lactamase class A